MQFDQKKNIHGTHKGMGDNGPDKINQKMPFLGLKNLGLGNLDLFSVLNPNLETHVFKSRFTNLGFSAIVDFILWFCTSLSSETWSFELISQQQKKVFKPSFSKLVF